MKFFIEDVNIFYLTLYGGIAIGLIFDLYRALRSNFKIVRKISLVFDVIFWFLITLVIFTTINLLEKFDLRYYHFVALFLGFILYYNTISKYILIAFNKIISFTNKTIAFTRIYLTIYTYWLLFILT